MVDTYTYYYYNIYFLVSRKLEVYHRYTIYILDIIIYNSIL